MSISIRHSASLVALASTSLLVGCAVFETAEAPHSQDEAVANGTTGSPHQGQAAGEPMAKAGQSRATPLFNGGSPDRPEVGGDVRFSNVVSVGLYGETSPGEEPNVAMQGDGNIKQVSFAPEGGDFTPDIDRTGAFLVYASKQHSQSFDIYRKAIDGRTVTQVTSDPSDDMMPSISPDGKHIAFVSNRTGNWDVFIMPTEGGPPTQVTFESDDEVQPTWSPDGRQLAFARKNARTSRWEIWTTTAHEPSGSTFLCEGFLPRWCPEANSNCILFQRARQQGSRFYGIWTIRLENGQAMNPTEIVSAQNAAVIQPSWSPDGSRIVFTTVVDPTAQSGEMPEQSDLWVINIDGTGRMSLTGGHFRNMQPVWGADEKIYFVSNRAGVENLWCVSPTLGGGSMEQGSNVASVPTEGAVEEQAAETAVGER
ncbi:MAG: PD40 domain-containing protein [Phycisphaerae bacterium]|jgi:TolB protein|nr:PD40 domain-containing protein [Phycisphaerae bacterium]